MSMVILAGEAVFMLPFMVPRLYRPLILEGWGFTNTDIGSAFAVYGVVAMLSYLFGGPFADKYHPRVLISASLVGTATACLYLVWFPTRTALVATYGVFGASTIFLMWSALIRTTHIAGGESRRSLAMGVLDGGRGLAAAGFSSLLVFIVHLVAPTLANTTDQVFALKVIYLSTAAFTLLIAAGIWFTLGDFHSGNNDSKLDFAQIAKALKNPDVWLLSVVILGSYCGYKSIDNYSTYLVDVHQLDLSTASQFTSVIFWLRPISAFVAGVLADDYQARMPSGRFLALIALLSIGGLCELLLAFGGSSSFYYGFFVIILSASFAYGLRAVYFSVFGDLKIPYHLLGTTTGIVSFIGFMPDVFFGLITGRMIDTHPGEAGFQMAFVFTAVCLFLGAGASLALYRRSLN